MGVLPPSCLSSIHQYSQQCLRRSHAIVHRGSCRRAIDGHLLHGRVMSREPVPTGKGQETSRGILVHPRMARLDTQAISHVACVRRSSFSDARKDERRHWCFLCEDLGNVLSRRSAHDVAWGAARVQWASVLRHLQVRGLLG